MIVRVFGISNNDPFANILQTFLAIIVYRVYGCIF